MADYEKVMLALLFNFTLAVWLEWVDFLGVDITFMYLGATG
jgi:hypothetical protein